MSAIAISRVCKLVDVLAHLSKLRVGIGQSELFYVDEISGGLKRNIIGIQAIRLIDFQ